MIGPLDHRTIGPLILQKNRLLVLFFWNFGFKVLKHIQNCWLILATRARSSATICPKQAGKTCFEPIQYWTTLSWEIGSESKEPLNTLSSEWIFLAYTEYDYLLPTYLVLEKNTEI